MALHRLRNFVQLYIAKEQKAMHHMFRQAYKAKNSACKQGGMLRAQIFSKMFEYSGFPLGGKFL